MSDDLFVVVCPTYNRVATLARAVDSLLTQTDDAWIAYVLDDGSTDGTPALMATYQDPRIRYQRFDQNRGGVAMNEIGMALAREHGQFWTRLGSDDWFLPEKLALDRRALTCADACFGPYRNDPSTWGGELNIPMRARETLVAGSFAVSWANIAYRTSVLAEVHQRYGNFVDPRLRNMEDYLFNVRAARVTEFVWRALSIDGSQMVIGATAPEQVPFAYKPDAMYTVALESATYGATMRAWVTQDAILTDKIRGEDWLRGHPTVTIPAPSCMVVPWQ